MRNEPRYINLRDGDLVAYGRARRFTGRMSVILACLILVIVVAVGVLA